jgi:basic amino acid/polyamine antiporter, APA family
VRRMSAPDPAGSRLSRELGVTDAVLVGLGSMIGAGIFAALGPAAEVAGTGLLLGLAVAGFVAYCNATSSAQLAALHPQAGGTYVYARARLGRYWGNLAGWSFLVGKTASCAAMALTFGAYVAPAQASALAIAAVVGLTGVNLLGIRKTATLTRVVVAVVLAVLAFVVAAALLGGTVRSEHLGDLVAAGPLGVLQAAGLLFFAFAGYARIATLGEEVREPATTIPRAVPRALGITLAVYVLVAVAALLAVGPEALAASDAPLATAVEAGRFAALSPVVTVGAATAALGVLLSMIAGVSRTTFAMAADRELPHPLAAVHPTRRVPHRAELAVGIVVVAVVARTDLRGAIGFSAFGTLVYYALANASALRLSPDERRWPAALAAAGLAGCVVLALSLPLQAMLVGAGLLGVASAAFSLRLLAGGR